MSSLARPRRIGVIGSNGKFYYLLCKPKDDLRKDARVLEFYGVINKLLISSAEARKRRLCQLQGVVCRLLLGRYQNICRHSP